MNKVINEVSTMPSAMLKNETFWPMEPTPMIISGCIKSGKTYFMLNLLEHKYYDYFDYIIFICPTFYDNQTYISRQWLKRDPRVFVFTGLDVNLIIQYIKKKFKGTNTVIILDDVAFMREMKTKRNGELVQLVFSLRHVGFSLWVLTQKYNAIIKDFRENLYIVVAFFNKDIETMEAILKESGVEKEKWKEITAHLKKKKHAKIIIRTIHPYMYVLS